MEALRATEPADGDALVFVGFMGAGKSGAAPHRRGRAGRPAADSDRELEGELGEPLESFFDREGEAAFRARGGSSSCGCSSGPCRRCWRWAAARWAPRR